jgi:hypothetical protein
MINHGFARKVCTPSTNKSSSYSFTPKQPGSAIKFNQFKREGCELLAQFSYFEPLRFSQTLILSQWAVITTPGMWSVLLQLLYPRSCSDATKVRSEFDQMLLNHARSSGASVYEKTKVESISFSSSDPDRPISVSWAHTPPPCPISPPASPIDSSFPAFLTGNSPIPTSDSETVHGVTKFTHMIDATGRAGILSTRYFKNRHFNASLKNIAVWGYWRSVGQYGAGTSRHGSPWFETLTGPFLLTLYMNSCRFRFSRCIRMGLVHPPP